MRIGIHASASGKSDNAVEELLSIAQRAADHGLDFWMPQLTGLDALNVLPTVARETKGLARVGTAVVPTFPRHPLVMAMEALTVQAATGNRLVLGIGLSHQVVIEGMYGIPFTTPVRHMREYLEVLMPALHTGTVQHEGEEYRVQTYSPLKVAGATPPPVLVAALGEQMLKVAGRLADGTALWMVGPKTIESHIVPTITAAAEAAGRPRPQVAVGLPVSVTADVNGARERAAKVFGFYNNLPSYRSMLDREGADGPVDVAIIGDEDEVASRLRQLGDIGATALSLPVFGSAEDQERTLTILAELAREAN